MHDRYPPEPPRVPPKRERDAGLTVLMSMLILLAVISATAAFVYWATIAAP